MRQRMSKSKGENFHDDFNDYDYKKKRANDNKQFLNEVVSIVSEAQEELTYIRDEQEHNPGCPEWIEELGSKEAHAYIDIVHMMSANLFATDSTKKGELRDLKILANKCMWDDFIKMKLYQYIKHLKDGKN